MRMRSIRLSKNGLKHSVIAKISRSIEVTTGSSNLASNFKPEVDIWLFLRMRSRKLIKMAENVTHLPKYQVLQEI